MPFESYNEERIFKEDIEPIIDELVAKCQEHDIPLMLYACYEMREAANDTLSTTSRSVLVGRSNRMPTTYMAAYQLAKGNTPLHHMAAQLVLSASPPMDEE